MGWPTVWIWGSKLTSARCVPPLGWRVPEFILDAEAPTRVGLRRHQKHEGDEETCKWYGTLGGLR